MPEVYWVYDGAALAKVGPTAVLQALRHRPRVRQHLPGDLLRVIGRAGRRWLAITLIECDQPDHYLVVSARELDPPEAEVVRRLLARPVMEMAN